MLLLLAGTFVASAASLRYERDEATARSAAEGARAADVITLGMGLAAESLDGAAGLFDASQTVSEATGTAPTSQAGRASRSASAAARIVEPVARPSSTRITVLPATSGGDCEPR